MKIVLQLCARGNMVAFGDEWNYLKFLEPFNPTDPLHQVVAADLADPMGPWHRDQAMDREQFLARMDAYNQRADREYNEQIAKLNARDAYFTSGQFDEDEEG